MKCGTPFLLFLLTACAQIREPLGGEKDVSPPTLLSAEPANGSVWFAADRIVLHFNERVKLDHLRERLLISPPLDKQPEVQVVGGTDVVLQLKAPLLPNTTYTFNIGETVVDLTEGNAAAGLSYVVSTGDVLDSLLISGVVVDAFNTKPEDGVLVVLHSDTDSTGFTTGRPGYFTRTDKDGGFTLRNLRSGSYQLHALKDQNANFRYDLPNERVAFLDDRVISGDSAFHELRMFLGEAPVQQVIEALVQPDRGWRLVLARSSDTIQLRQLDRVGGSLSWALEWNETRDTVLFWPSDTTLLADQRFVVSDSSGTLDTLTYRVQRKMPFYLDVKAASSAVDGQRVLVSARPVRSINRERVEMRIDSSLVDCALAIDPNKGRQVLVSAIFPDDKRAVLTLLPGALEDIYGGRNDTLRLALGNKSALQTGDLKIRLSRDTGFELAGPFILQVLNAQGGVFLIERFSAFPFASDRPGVVSGSYTVKLIEDLNGDGYWSTGSLKDQRQPERVFRQQGEVQVRAGWEVGVDWKVSAH
ncbi:MAG: Ig-like domain-containing protein [Flavobacteriales bacterium]|nr:Ig-like domain-containing protein [Flavobacteriales bacterium]